jgi:hypothetical protein
MFEIAEHDAPETQIQMRTHTFFFSNSDRDFYSKSNNVWNVAEANMAVFNIWFVI